MEHVSFVVDPHRWHPLQHRMAYDAAREDILDEADWRIRAIREKHLAVGDIAAYSHQAVYLRWCIEKSLMSGDFEKTYAAVTETARQSPEKAALREFIRDKLGGVLRRSYFNQEGQDFPGTTMNGGGLPIILLILTTMPSRISAERTTARNALMTRRISFFPMMRRTTER